MNPTEVGIRELKTHLSKYMKQVKAGATLVITEYGKPIGRIIPVTSSLEEQTQELLNAGVIVWNRQEFSPPLHRPSVRGKRTVAELLLEDRGCFSTWMPVQS